MAKPTVKPSWIAILLASSAFAQTFEVTSVRPSNSANPGTPLNQFLPSGRFISTNMPLKSVIAIAWGLSMQSQRLTVASGVRIPDEHYDIEATAEAGAFPPGMATEARVARMQLMLRALLEDRFKLTVRMESKDQPVYALVVDKGGPKLEKWQSDGQSCTGSGVKMISNPACHFLDASQNRGIHGSVTIANVVSYLENFTDRPLLDKTGLTDFYNIQTEGWAPMRVSPTPDAPATSDDRPTLFEIFQKLGLRMERQRAVIDMFVIDHVERPSDN